MVRPSKWTRRSPYLALLLAAVLACSGPWVARMRPDQVREFWGDYKAAFIEDSGRVVRPGDGRDTVSEGQAYAMLMAVWMDDQATFDRCYGWTEANLSRKGRMGDSLLAWHFAPPAGVTDWNSAADADEDYALALLFAARRWGKPGLAGLPAYADKAGEVMADILEHEARLGPDGRRYLIPGPWEELSEERFILNPSYLSPAAYRIFYEQSRDERWLELVDSSYHLLDRLGRTAPLVPDWCLLGRDGELAAAAGFSGAYGWEALRTPWRLALDWLWFAEPRAEEFLGRVAMFYQAELKRRGALLALYTPEGAPAADYESAAAYAGAVAALPAGGQRSKAAARLAELGRRSVRLGDYYNASWAWFGLALATGCTPNILAE